MSGIAVRIGMEEKNATSVAQGARRSAGSENRTGIPTRLKERMEQSTGMSFDDVRVHYNSALPAKLDALAYTKGNQIEIGPGQERHLPHELGHVVQQKLGVVRANATHSSGVAMNTDPGLECQADEIGAGKRVEIVQRMGDNVIQRCGEEKEAREILGHFYDEILALHQENPQYFAHPDRYKIVEGREYTQLRDQYNEMVYSKELTPGHHILGLADGGQNEQSNITPTGEGFALRRDLPAGVVEEYDRNHARSSKSKPKRIPIYKDNDTIHPGKNPMHTRATRMQQQVHAWQRKNKLRRKRRNG